MFQVEPEWAVAALLNQEDIPSPVWDPACGTGTITRVCWGHGKPAFGTDVASGGDFLTASKKMWPLHVADRWSSGAIPSIVCNPPFGLAEEFILHAVDLDVPVAAFLLRLAFLEGTGRRKRIFDPHPPARVWTFSKRVSCPPPGALINGRKASGGAMAFAWFVWERGWKGPGYQGGWLP